MSNSTKPTFTLLHFAIFQEKAGKNEETRLLSDNLTTKMLFEQVCNELELDSAHTPVRVSVNHTFADWEQNIDAGDIVAFIPPVAGG